MGHIVSIEAGDRPPGGFAGCQAGDTSPDADSGRNRADATEHAMFYRGIAIGIAFAVPLWAAVIWCIRII